MKIKTVMVLVELDNGHVHQVLASADKKKICVSLMKAEHGKILLSKRVKPVVLEEFTQ
jgi:hypothetical protein